MKGFAYTHLTPNGRKARGHLHAPSLQEAKTRLRAQGLLVTSLVPTRRKRQGFLRKRPLLDFTLQLASLLRAGLPVFESLSTLAEQEPLLQPLCDAIQEGTPLSAALQPHVEPLYTTLIAAGEASGSLPQTLERLADLLKRRQALQRKLISALLYPAVVATFCLAVTVLLLTVAVPSIASLLDGRNVSPFTTAVLSFSTLLRSYWWLLPLPLLPLFKLKRRLFPNTRRQAALARFLRTLATLQDAGVQLIEALQLARPTLLHPPLEQAFERAENRLANGRSLSAHLKTEAEVPPLLPRMLAVAEESGSLTSALHRLADLYTDETEKRLSRLAALAQPVILLILGAIVGTIMLAVLLPLTDISTLQ